MSVAPSPPGPSPYPPNITLPLLYTVLLAVPVPLPTPVALNTVPGLLSAAPMAVKSVEPALTMVYLPCILNEPAVSVSVAKPLPT